MSSRLPWLLLAASPLLLTGCGPALSEACPPVAAYTPSFLARAADELQQLPPDSPIATMIEDYGRERAMLRACRS